jgi:hypothetical protein
MPVLMVHDSPGGTREQYDEVVRRLTDGREMQSLSDWPVEGILAHCAGPSEAGWRVIDVWESEEAFQRFGETIGPLLAASGMAGEPRLFPLEKFVK